MLRLFRSEGIEASLKEVWDVSRVVRITVGLTQGLFLYTYGVFFYDHFGSNKTAFYLTVALIVFTDLCIFLTEVPTGAIGDHIGRKKTVIVSFLLQALSYFLNIIIFFTPSIAGSFCMGLLSAVAYSLSFTFFSGTFIAWIVDSTKERGSQDGHASILARSFKYLYFAQILGAAVGLSLYLSDYMAYAFFLGCVACIVCALYCVLYMQESASLKFYSGKFMVDDSIKRMREIIVTGGKVILGMPPLIYLSLIQTVVLVLLNVINYLWPISMKANYGVGKMTPYWFFIVFSSLGAALFGSRLLEWINRGIAKKGGGHLFNVVLWSWFALVSLFVAVSVATLGLGKVYGHMSLAFFVVTIMLCHFGQGFLMPAYNILLNNYIPLEKSQERATVMSFSSMFTSLVMIFLMFPSSGPSGEDTPMGWIIPSIIAIAVVLVLHPLMRRYQRNTGEIPEKVSDVWGSVANKSD